jgi:hypothetical protein
LQRLKRLKRKQHCQQLHRPHPFCRPVTGRPEACGWYQGAWHLCGPNAKSCSGNGNTDSAQGVAPGAAGIRAEAIVLILAEQMIAVTLPLVEAQADCSQAPQPAEGNRLRRPAKRSGTMIPYANTEPARGIPAIARHAGKKPDAGLNPRFLLGGWRFQWG